MSKLYSTPKTQHRVKATGCSYSKHSPKSIQCSVLGRVLVSEALCRTVGQLNVSAQAGSFSEATKNLSALDQGRVQDKCVTADYSLCTTQIHH